jgi:L-ribulose-5-phosphate 3-epimerase
MINSFLPPAIGQWATMQSRRTFIGNSAIAIATLAASADLADAQENQATDKQPAAEHSSRLKKTLKLNMVKGGKSLAEKFAIARSAGFEGIELNAPGFDVEEAKAAMESTGLIIDGTVNSNHWQVRHSDPDPAVRAVAAKSCMDGLRATAAVGADTMLLVVGHGKDGTPDEVWERTIANIQPAIPLAEELGVKIAVENVWNQFLYDHDGDTNQTADEMARYIDAFHSPWVGVQFDIGNHWKYGDPAGWIRTLGKRIVKLDVKGFSRAKNGWTSMTDSDIDWASVRQALIEVDFRGWVAAEMAGGDLEYLTSVNNEMDELLIRGTV